MRLFFSLVIGYILVKQYLQREQQWNTIAGRPPQSRTSSLSEDDRKRAEEMHQREQQRHMPARPEARDHRSYYSNVR